MLFAYVTKLVNAKTIYVQCVIKQAFNSISFIIWNRTLSGMYEALNSQIIHS